MGLLSKMLGGRPGEVAINASLRDAVRVLPGVTHYDLKYNHQPNASGAISGTVEVADSATFLQVLRTSYRTLHGLLGTGADGVVFYLSGRTPDGVSVTPGELGLTQPPGGREIAQRLRP